MLKSSVCFLSELLLIYLCFSGVALAAAQSDNSWQAQAADELRIVLETAPEQLSQPLTELLAELSAESEQTFIPDFYRTRHYLPMWTTAQGPLNRAYDLLQVITDAEDEGLKPSDYRLDEIRKHWETTSLQDAIYLELLLSNAMYRYSNHVYSGRFPPAALDVDWHIKNAPLDSKRLFTEVEKKDSIKKLLQQLPPPHSVYQSLKKELKRFRDIEQMGGWKTLRSGPVLSPGMQHKQVLELKQRMLISGDLSDSVLQDVDIFDHELAEAVISYQTRNGLEADGKIGPQTRRSLNIPVSEKIKKIRINMERWRWLPRKLGRRYLVVNMTGFELYLMENGSPVLVMPVIIGKAYRATPTFSGWLSVMEYNPYWTVPRTIAIEDMLPRLRRDPGYLEKKSIKLYRGWANAQEIDPRTVDWKKVDKDNFPYWMRQEPGPKNALGQVKFLFSNPYQIYLHGTPDKHLFDRTVRTLSSGCIRVKDPVKLAAYLLDDGSQQTEEDVLANIYFGNNQKIQLPVSPPIYLIYLTAWAYHDGKINFRPDVYGRDKLLNKAFDNN